MLLGMRSTLLSSVAFTPASLFASGEPGGWYDPSDLTTLFQDSAGTTPVTAVEQPVGLMLDKSGRGNHLTQSTSTARPVLSARVNLLTQTEAFNEAVWGKTNITVTANTAETTDPLGGNTADKALETITNAGHFIDLTSGLAVTNGVTYTRSVCLKFLGRQWAVLDMFDTVSRYTYFDIQNGVVGTNAAGTTASIQNLSNGWFRCSITRTVTASTIYVATLTTTSDGGSVTFAGDTTKGYYIWGADLRVANDGVNIPVYQRVGVGTPGTSSGAGSSDYTVTGFPLYLRFDGTDDFMVSPTITPGIDKAQVFAGVRKLNQSAVNMIAEFSADKNSNNGVFALYNGATDGFVWISKGTSEGASSSTSGFTAPVSAVLTGIGNIAGDISTLQANATQIASSSSDQGTGNYLAYPFYVGARAGTSLFFNGRLYPLIVRFGATLTDTQIAQTESYVSTQMGGGYVPTGYDFLVDANGDQLTDASGNALYTIPLYS